MTMRTYYPDRHQVPEPEPEEIPRDTGDPHNIAWGYNLADINELAHRAARRTWNRSGYDIERYEAAWSAIAEAVCTAESWPAPADLAYTGWAAAIGQRNDITRGAGYDLQTGRLMPRYFRCWTPAASSTVEDRVVDAAALWQILPVLPPRERQAVTVLAATGDYTLAADAMGLPYKAYVATVARARKRFLALWHEGETPPTMWRRDQRRSRSRVTPALLEEIRGRYYAGGVTYRGLAVEYGVSRSRISDLLSGGTLLDHLEES